MKGSRTWEQFEFFVIAMTKKSLEYITCYYYANLAWLIIG